MKKVLVLFVFALFTITTFNSCEPEDDGRQSEIGIDKEDVESPDDRD